MTKSYKLLICLFVLIAVITAYISCTDGGDFDVYLQAARQLSKRQNIYVPPFVKGLQYYYSVFFALILSPVGSYIFATEFAWLLLSYCFLFRIMKLMKAYFNIDVLSNKQQIIWFVLSVILSLQFLMYDVSLIQVTIFLLWSILESLQLIRNDREILGGMLLATAINIKIMPILMLPYLFYRGYFKSVVTAVLFFIILLYLPAIFIGWKYNNFLLAEWWKVINPGNKEHMFELGIGTHSIVAMLPVYLTPTVGEMPYRRNIVNIDYSTIGVVINATRVLLLGISLFFFKTLPFKRENNTLKMFWEAAYFMLLIPLLLPHQQKYNFLLVLPMIVYLLYFFISKKWALTSIPFIIALVVFSLSMVIFSPIYGSDIIGGFLFRLTQHYRFMTFATLFIIPVALICNPGQLENLKTIKGTRHIFEP